MFFKENLLLKIDSAASTGSQGKITLYVPWLPVEAALSIFNNRFCLMNDIWEGIIKNKGDFHQCRIISFLKISVLKRSVLSFSRSWRHDQTLPYMIRTEFLSRRWNFMSSNYNHLPFDTAQHPFISSLCRFDKIWLNCNSRDCANCCKRHVQTYRRPLDHHGCSLLVSQWTCSYQASIMSAQCGWVIKYAVKFNRKHGNVAQLSCIRHKVQVTSFHYQYLLTSKI